MPPLFGTFHCVGLGVGLLSADWISLPTGATGLSTFGFLGDCLVLAILYGLYVSGC